MSTDHVVGMFSLVELYYKILGRDICSRVVNYLITRIIKGNYLGIILTNVARLLDTSEDIFI